MVKKSSGSTSSETSVRNGSSMRGHGSARLARSYDIHLRITLQIVSHTTNVQRVALAHDRTLHCGNGINRRHPSGKDVPTILAEFLHSA